MKRISTLVSVFIVFLACGLPQRASAEFLKTGPGVYQSTGKRAKIIIGQEQPGIFLLYGPEIDVQVFNPLDIKNESTISHAFIRFDPQLNRYTALIVGKREYRIIGSFTLNLDKMRVTVDNNNPYISIVVDQDGQNPAEILGLLGLSTIVNYSGEKAVALLEANQFSEYKGVVSPYQIENGSLLVKGQPINNNSVGLTLDLKNPCLKTGAIVLAKEDLESLGGAKSKDEGRQLFTNLVETSKKKNALKSLLKLQVTPESIIALDPIQGSVKVVRKTAASSPTTTICSIDEVKF